MSNISGKLCIIIFGMLLCSMDTALMGEYFLDWKEFGKCTDELEGTDQVQMNLHLSKKNRKTELLGNFTLLIPLDDSISIDVNYWQRSPSGRWNPNALNIKFPRACSGTFNLLGSTYKKFMRSMNASTTCPLSKGVYIEPGFDLDNFRSSEMPKSFIYGNYKHIVKYMKNQRVIGCVKILIHIKPAWEQTG